MNLMVVGLIFEVIGVWLVAYDLIWGLKRRNRLYIVESQLNNLSKHLKQMKSIIEKTPSPPYSQQQIQEFLSENEEQWEPRIAELTFEKSKLENTPDFVAMISLLGLVMISVGAILQIIKSWTI
jgi:hypothetical protein